MANDFLTRAQKYVSAIRKSGLSIYDAVLVGDPLLWLPTPELEAILDKGLAGLSLDGLPLRTRSKTVKEEVCRILGYPIPKSFKKTKPRFPGQMFDTYSQKASNLQVWNEELSGTRRYVIIQVNQNDVVGRVKVVTGESLALLDRTGTLTKKYQARCIPGTASTELIAKSDTTRLLTAVSAQAKVHPDATPVQHPVAGEIISIAELYRNLSGLVGSRFKDAGIDQERNRGAELHRLVSKALGYSNHRDDGQFPDIRHQLLEVKLQTSPTIDLGVVTPASKEPLDVPMINGHQVRHCDVRYAIFYGRTDGFQVQLTNFFLSTGEAFFSRFPQFGGKVLNSKLQMKLPDDFFDR
ncbi:MAG: restriction endonuclease [Verrucomicrobiaceae bacterium]|nr:MAG: restriction endonuclease [Verrucomicrobiaceae bacterium]